MPKLAEFEKNIIGEALREYSRTLIEWFSMADRELDANYFKTRALAARELRDIILDHDIEIKEPGAESVTTPGEH